MENREKSMDLYLIAGQSNAGGYTLITDREAAYARMPALRDGVPHVHYAGDSRGDGPEHAEIAHHAVEWQPVRLGFGVYDEEHFGPEAGMARVLSEVYSPETGRHAGIIKLTHGGTSLLYRDNADWFGNWMPPSYAAEKGFAWNENSRMGGLYRAFLQEVKKQLSALPAYGFGAFRLVGLYWMQGEGNRSFPAEYQRAFEYWAADMRRDLSALMQELSGGDGDYGASRIPIVVGTISATFGLDNAESEQINRTFIQMQKGLPEVISRCSVVDHSEFAQARWDHETNSRVVLGTDHCHWNQSDMLDIGEDVGSAMLTWARL